MNHSRTTGFIENKVLNQYCLQKIASLKCELGKINREISEFEKKLAELKIRKESLVRRVNEENNKNIFAKTHLQIAQLASKML